MTRTPEPRPPTSDELRTFYAMERTLMAWIRTGLAMMGFGFLVARFGLFLRELAAVRREAPAATTGLSLWIGTAMILLGVAVLLFAAAEPRRSLRHVGGTGLDRSGRSRFQIALAICLAALGGLMAGCLVFMGPGS